MGISTAGLRKKAEAHETKDSFYYRPLIPLLLFFMAGIGLAHLAPAHFPMALAIAGIGSTASIICLISSSGARWSPLLLFLSLGYLSLAPWQLATADPAHVSRFITDSPWQITGRIASDPEKQGYRLKFVLSDIRLAKNSAAPPHIGPKPQPISGRLRITVYGQVQKRPAYGDRIAFNGSIRALHNFNNPGGFDYKQFMAYRDIWASTYTSGNALYIKQKPGPSGLIGQIQKKRRELADFIGTSVQGDARAVLATLALGSRELIPPRLEEAFNRAGASHILAISGLHIGIVATVSFLFLSCLLRRLLPMRYAPAAGKAAAAFALIPVWAYALLADLSPSTQRAAIMVSVFLSSLMIEREHELINTLAAAALIILCIHPPALFAVSFQLSFMAVLAIIAGLFAARPAIATIGGNSRLFRWLLNFMAVSFFAILGTAPIVMHYFNQVAFLGILTNLLIIPAIGFIVVPLTLFALLVCLPLHPGLARCGLNAAEMVVDQVLPVIYRIGALPWSAAKTITPSWLEMACIYSLLFALLFLIQNRHSRAPSARARQTRATAALLLILAVFAADIVYWCHHRYWNREVRITVMDVGQGSSALLELPGGYRMLIDGGGFTSNAVFDVGKNVVAPLLWHKKIGRLDAVVLSHPDADHLNGLIYILKHFGRPLVISTHQQADTQGYDEFIRIIKEKSLEHPGFGQIPRHFEVGGACVDILHPVRKSASSPKDASSNNHSLVLKAGFHGRSILFPGDIMAAAEQRLISRAPADLDATVLVAPHHGSQSSSTPAFLDTVDPEAVVISAGIQNRFNLPAPAVLARYRKRGCQVLATNKNGAVEIIIDEKGGLLAPVLGKPVVLGVGY